MKKSRGAFCLFAFCFCLFSALFAQKTPSKKRSLEHSDYHLWKKIEQPQLSADGKLVAYALAPVTEGDSKVCLFESETEKITEWPRGAEPRFSDDARWLFFKIRPPLDSVKAQKRLKKKDDELPKDTLAIFEIASKKLTKIAAVKSFSVPKDWSGWLVFELEPKNPEAKKDTSKTKKDPPKKAKKEGKENGNSLIIRHLATEKQDTVPFVAEHVLAEKKPRLALVSTGRDSGFAAGVYLFDFEKNALRPMARGRGAAKNLAFDRAGERLAFVTDFDTTAEKRKAQLRQFDLWLFDEKGANASDSARQILTNRAPFDLPDARRIWRSREWLVSPHQKPVFSDDGRRLFFGLAPLPVLPDTTRLAEETVKVEVWQWETELHTRQENQLEAERKRSFWAFFDLFSNKIEPLASPDAPTILFSADKNANAAIGADPFHWQKLNGWEGAENRDFYFIDLLKKRETWQFAKRQRGSAPQISPDGRWAFWYSERDSAWFAADYWSKKTWPMTDNRAAKFFDEEWDLPDHPEAHGAAGWLADGSGFLVYDRFDIWLLRPEKPLAPERLTRGREIGATFRRLKIDAEEKWVPADSLWLLHQFFEKTKAEGHALFSFKERKTDLLAFSEFASFSKNPMRAERSGALLFSIQNFKIAPDLLLKKDWKSIDVWQKASNSNPQQADFLWGDGELVEWRGPDGEAMTGMLFKPEGFRADRKYPMIVNFYERSSDGLNQYRAVDPHRSQICYPYYLSRGYLIFNPDIRYKTGQPGHSAAQAVVSGTQFLIKKGFVDKSRVGLQGHSWGGYQIAHILTQTDLFRCAESGAPVVNMTSAYGGVRLESGLSRIFQYEKSQSRIGATLWERPDLFLDNSPLFLLDKMTTPVLILHNDKDGAVPFGQGVEYFMALRRLGKPCWLLNYNDEPHWPVKLQNRLDFQRRMEQYFDHFLKDAPEPCWMKRGVPAIEKMERLGFETDCED